MDSSLFCVTVLSVLRCLLSLSVFVGIVVCAWVVRSVAFYSVASFAGYPNLPYFVQGGQLPVGSLSFCIVILSILRCVLASFVLLILSRALGLSFLLRFIASRMYKLC